MSSEKPILAISEVASPVRRRQYLVPVVVLKPVAERKNKLNGWFADFDTVPVLGPAHGDPEISWAAAQQHYHVDWRFMSAASRQAVRREGDGPGHEKGIVVWAADVVRFELQPVVYRGPASEWEGQTPRQLRTILEPLHVASVVGETKRCPHRGADLTHCKPDGNGVVTCPVHGLRWQVATGQLVPTTPAAQALIEVLERAPAPTPSERGNSQPG